MTSPSNPTLDLLPDTLDVQVYVRGAWWFELDWTDDLGAPLDMTTATITAQFRKPDSTADPLKILSVGDGLVWLDRPHGKLRVIPTAAQLAALTLDAYVLEFWRQDGSDPAAVAVRGHFRRQA